MSQTRTELMMRTQFYFELNAVGVFDLMSLGSGMTTQWYGTETGRKILEKIKKEFTKVLDGEAYITIERMEITNCDDKSIELGILVNIQGAIVQNRMSEDISDLACDAASSICELYEQESNSKLNAGFEYYDTHQLNRMG